MFRNTRFLATVLTALSPLVSLAVADLTVDGTILVLARSADEAYSAYSGLNGHGIPYEVLVVPQEGVDLPALNSSATAGNYGGIITLGEVSYDYNGTYSSALSDDQWNAMYAYQAAFGVRMVRLDAYPEPQFGKSCNGHTAKNSTD